MVRSGVVVCLFLTGCRDTSIEHYKRGRSYHKTGQYELAITDYTKVIKINPRDAAAYEGRAIAYYHIEEYDKACEDAHKDQSLGYKVDPKFLRKLRED